MLVRASARAGRRCQGAGIPAPARRARGLPSGARGAGRASRAPPPFLLLPSLPPSPFLRSFFSRSPSLPPAGCALPLRASPLLCGPQPARAALVGAARRADGAPLHAGPSVPGIFSPGLGSGEEARGRRTAPGGPAPQTGSFPRPAAGRQRPGAGGQAPAAVRRRQGAGGRAPAASRRGLSRNFVSPAPAPRGRIHFPYLF